MSYVLINGTRYYKDDKTGRITKDNVSEEVAEQRAKRNQSSSLHSNSNAHDIWPYNTVTQANGNNNYVRKTSAQTSSFPWGIIIVIIVVAFVGAFLYNRSHISSAEQQISEYMEGASQYSNNSHDNTEENNIGEYSETYQSDYLLPYSAERYLSEEEIGVYSHDEIQLMINEIYARHGREFDSQRNREYFLSKDWYEPIQGKTDEEIVSELNKYEMENINLLKKYL